MAVPEYKTGDTWPPITGTVSDANGVVDISSAASLRFIAKSGAFVIAGAAENLDDGQPANAGKWKYTWGANDLANAGEYECEIEITWSAGVIETFPSKDSNNPTFAVTDDLD
jgi:hypothetical protein